MNVRSLKQVAVAGVVASALAACADAPTMAPSVRADAPSMVLNTTPVINTFANTVFTEEKIVVCKDFTGSTLSYPTANFSAVFTGTYNTTVNFSLNDGQCADLGFFGGTGVDVTVTEAPIANYATSYTTQTFLAPGGLQAVSGSTVGNVASGSAYGSRPQGTPPAVGTRIVFTNDYVPPSGCTFTQGYWKTHSSYGPAPYDDGWLAVGGADAAFFLSGQTWLQVFNTAPAGNAYYNLAHQYMAAKLNSLNGASVPGNVATAISDAETLFNAYTPAQVAALAKSSTTRAQFITLAGTLGSYNEGSTGPGHCGS